MRLTPEQVAEEKKYLSELKERVWFGEHGLTSAEQDLFDTIEALQQENEQLQARVARMREALEQIEEHLSSAIPVEGFFENMHCCSAGRIAEDALAAIDALGGKEDA